MQKNFDRFEGAGICGTALADLEFLTMNLPVQVEFLLNLQPICARMPLKEAHRPLVVLGRGAVIICAHNKSSLRTSYITLNTLLS